jgi:hypothetical protein
MKLEEYESPIKVFLNGTFQNSYRPAVRTLCSVINIFKLCEPIWLDFPIFALDVENGVPREILKIYYFLKW